MSVKKRFFSRSQVTPFIIIGLVIVILVFAAIYVTQSTTEENLQSKQREVTGSDVLSSFDLYVKQCIDNEAYEPLIEIGKQGGTLSPQEPFLWYNQSRLSYLCYSEGIDPSVSCVNYMLTKDQMEYELSVELKKSLQKCINLDEFRRFVENISAEEMHVDVAISKDSVVVNLDYPVNFTYKESVESVSKFTEVLDYPLGRLYDISQQIIYDETTESDFNIDKWMNDHGADVLIQKHRPYPDKVYILSKNGYTFQFAIQQLSSVGQFVGEKENYYGCCFTPAGRCFKNTDPLRCVELNGDYNPDQSCSCMYTYQEDTPCTGPDCNDCDDVNRKHGESWCEYDSITGRGYDLIGSRQYKYSCINGTVLVEECRDYREELCTEQVDQGSTVAECRPNRWQSCSQCTSQACCNDVQLRDCYWDNALSTEGKCVPQVPPGLRFWQNEGADVCMRGNQEKECEGLSCPQSWLDSTARYCYSQGDCGNYLNYLDDYSAGGYYETDLIRNTDPRESIPEDTQSISDLQLTFDKESQDVIETETNQFNTLFVFISSIADFLGEIANIDITAYANPFASRRRIAIKDYSICNLWIPPAGSLDCSDCSNDPERPCTEYRCRSIGETCQFEMKQGVPYCEKVTLDDSSPPVVQIDTDVIDDKYSVEQAYLADYEGYRIIEPVKPHKPFTFGIKTNKETRCSVSLTPRIKDYSLQTVMLGDGAFSTRHNITMRMPPRFVVPDKLYSVINLTETNSVLDIFYNIRTILNSVTDNLESELYMYQLITGKSFLDQINKKTQGIINIIDSVTSEVDVVIKALLTQFDEGGYYLFFDCIDRAGNSNTDQVFLQFWVDYDYEDTDPPMIIAEDPEDNSMINPLLNLSHVSIYIDEPAECRFDYQDVDYSSMSHSFDCPATAYEISPVAGGTYECTAEVSTAFKENHIYIRCADNPRKVDSYILRLIESDSMGVLGLENLTTDVPNATPMDYISLGPGTIDVDADMLDRISFGINQSEIDLNLYLDDAKQCTYAEAGFNEVDFSGCSLSDDLMKGVYRCNAHIIPRTLSNRTLGVYDLDINTTYRNKTVDVNPDRITMINTTVTSSFGRTIYGHDYIDINFTSIDINLGLKEQAECSYTANKSIGSLPLSCSWDSNTTICSIYLPITKPVDLSFECINTTPVNISNITHEYYIRCRGADTKDRNVNPISFEYSLSKAEELKIIDIQPAGVINTTKTVLTVKVSEDIIKNRVTCGYNDNPYSYLKMDAFAYREFRVDLPELEEDKDYTYYIQCRDNYGSIVSKTAEFKAIT